MSKHHYDAVVIGGGPGGSTTATYLARAGKRALVLEKEHFPRFHIGESLLPYNQLIFEDMGVMPALEAAGFPRKFGAQFHLGNGSKSVKFLFREGRFNRATGAIQVERATFDTILLKHAQSCGAEVREGWTVQNFNATSSEVTVEACSDTGERASISAPFLIDASGRGNLTGNQEGLRAFHPKLRKLAIFGHFRGVRLDEGESAGDTVIVRLANKWFWIIPITAEKTSVGCVMEKEEFLAANASPGDVFARLVASSAPLRERMAAAQLVGPMQATSDFSYRNRRLCGPRLLRVGDAAGFIDPIFSSGVYLAMHSGKLAAGAVVDALGGKDMEKRFRSYERQLLSAMDFYWEMVENFYTTPFMEVFLHPRSRFDLPGAINALLAGELEGGWKMRWRLRLFYLIIRAQSRWTLAPRITFD